MSELTEKEEGEAMSPDKPLFESRDPGTADPSTTDRKGSKYTGQERRRKNRRNSKDRRADVRFEIDKNDRREKAGRRHDDAAPKFW